MIHFADLKRDLPGQIGALADFLQIPVQSGVMGGIVQHCGFDYMKTHAAASVPLGGAFWQGGAQTFIHKGTNGRWKDTLRPQVSARYQARAQQELGSECAQWLASGSAA